ncbi:MAG: hypothetical protein WD023_06500 [Ilumatobacteraceae bacterium]
MMNLEMSCSDGCAVISASGSLSAEDDIDIVVAALVFVPPDDHLVLDLLGVDRLSASGAVVLAQALLERAACAAEVVVVIDRPDVAVRLIVNDVDRVVPMVATMQQAVQVVMARSGFDAMEVA